MIRFHKGRRGQVEEPVEDKDTIADIVDRLDDMDNCPSLKNNVEYKLARFIQASKMTKKSTTIFFSNPTLVHNDVLLLLQI